jgi:uncharacterized surface protein with fasciclin (FAS1) repeats
MKTYPIILMKSVKAILILLVFAAMISCNNDSDTIQEDRNIMQILMVNTNFSTFQEMIMRTDLGDELSSDGPFTVFAPTNEAVDNFLFEQGLTRQQLMESSELRDVVLYHVMAGRLLTSQIPVGDMETLSPNQNLSFSIADNSIVINGNTNILTPDVAARNGVIHGINRVLVAPVDTTEDNSVIGVLGRDENFSLLGAAVEAAGLREMLSTSAVTFFAPTDVAFEAYLEENDMEWAEFIGNTNMITSILLHHTLSGVVGLSDLESGPTNTALNRPIFLSVGEEIHLNGRARILNGDVPAENGLIHTVDQVLRPASRNLSEFITDQQDFTQLASAVVRLGKVQELTTGGPFTLFAPNDAAFAAAYEAMGVGGLADIEDGTLRDIINYNLVPGFIFSTDMVAGQSLTSVQGETVTVDPAQGTVGNGTFHPTRINRITTNGIVHVTTVLLLPPSMR